MNKWRKRIIGLLALLILALASPYFLTDSELNVDGTVLLVGLSFGGIIVAGYANEHWDQV